MTWLYDLIFTNMMHTGAHRHKQIQTNQVLVEDVESVVECYNMYSAKADFPFRPSGHSIMDEIEIQTAKAARGSFRNRVYHIQIPVDSDALPRMGWKNR
jgi:hypothetical protein